MPHFSADLLDALLDGDPAELEALRAILGGEPAAVVADAPGIPGRPARPDRCAACRPAPLSPQAEVPGTPAKLHAARPARESGTGARNTGRRPGRPAVRSRGGVRGHPARNLSGP
ncbi:MULTISPECIES: hypothetical protein [Methylobacterium]|uniref:hypothetical protein n=1 Tax=Methylobacterium TaxID=407 RepID=UPI0013ED4B4D|nr:hypothetical protein [Methylobacterium sp. DB0501]NGM34319.1 hypothetical protein [Methylobacterium sp. DB0501]